MRVLNAFRLVMDSLTQNELSTELLNSVNIPLHREGSIICEASTHSRSTFEPSADPQFENVVNLIVGIAVLDVAEI